MLFSELNSLSMVLDDVTAVVSSARIAAITKDARHISELRSNINLTHKRIIELRDTYVINNMVNASAFHAVIAPAIADLQIWLVDGVSGYAPDSMTALSIVRDRISEAFHKAAKIKDGSWIGAQNILEKERNRLETFQRSVNMLFLLTLVLACMLISLLFGQISIKNREIAANTEIQQQHALLTSLLHHIPLGITVWDKDKRFLHLNTGFSKITGYNESDLRILSDWPSLAYPDPIYRKHVMQHWKTTGRESSSCEYRVMCKNGTMKDIEFRTVLLPDLRTISTQIDVTERNRVEKAL
jgi:PAS domain S-box-containing protein